MKAVIAMSKMTNLLTLESDKELLKKKEEVQKDALVSFAQIADVEKKLGLVEKHAQFKELLILFDNFCRRNQIRYSLADGTLLGAYRHNQFIPWDDDADVMMTRGEYVKFEKALTNEDELVSFKLLFCHRVSTRKFYKQGIIVDIFVIDNIPKSRTEWEGRKILSRLLRASCFSQMSLPNIKSKGGAERAVLYLGFPIALLFGRIERMLLGKRVFDWNEKLADVKEKSGYCTKYTSNWRELNRIFKEEWFEEYIDIEMDGYPFMAIGGVEDYLVNMFGNWKSLPPKDEIRREHDHVPTLLTDTFINSWKET